MSKVLNTATTDSWQELFCPGTERITLQVSNAQVQVGFGEGFPAVSYMHPDETYLPVFASLVRTCDSVRVRSAVSGTPAVVSIITQP